MNNNEKVKNLLCNIDELPSLPGVAVKILEKINDDETSLHQLAEILSADPSLSAKVLSVVNSPFFGLPNEITNLPHAVSLLGEESLKYIALSFSLLTIFNDNKDIFDYSAFWRKSVTCAVISRLISKALERTDAEDMYFLGLILNIGILAIVRSHPEQYALVIKKVEEEKVDFHVAENAIFGCNHMDVGAYLIDTWGLPEKFSLPMLNHHNPGQIPLLNDNEMITAKIVHVGCEMSRFLHAEEKPLNLTMIHQLLNEYQMIPTVNIEIIVKKACFHIEPLLELFNIAEHDNIDYVEILEESKKQMYTLSMDMIKKIREQQQMIDNLSLIASQDGLTKLKNYKSFKEALERELDLCRYYGHISILALADLDNFKSVNDKLGHVTGDHVLKEISRFFMENTRKSDFVARYGGEEFAFILTRTSVDKGFKIIDRLRSLLSEMPIEFQNRKIFVTMSVGITCLSANDHHTGAELLKQADAAMYRAKKTGKNKTFIFKFSD